MEALPITGAYASEGITVSRVSDKNRNAKNALTEMDKIEWAKYIKQIANKDSLRTAITFFSIGNAFLPLLTIAIGIQTLVLSTKFLHQVSIIQFL